VDGSCGDPDLHWGRRRADDAYSALDYLIEHKLAPPDQVYLMGESNGGLATLEALSKKEADHKYRFAAGFPIVPQCLYKDIHHGTFYNPMILFLAAEDDANNPKFCFEAFKRKQDVPVQLVEYQGANHGFMMKAAPHIFHGWHLSYSPNAERDMMQTVLSAIKTKKFVKGIESR
jgi:dienelactone hydrolase